ncbi:MAG: hypothetical protein HYZ54_12710 [Ignavibacteriae bacterium]|nr:hypothetical protein [Ignavibacteriota bacterium]
MNIEDILDNIPMPNYLKAIDTMRRKFIIEGTLTLPDVKPFLREQSGYITDRNGERILLPVYSEYGELIDLQIITNEEALATFRQLRTEWQPLFDKASIHPLLTTILKESLL